MKKTMPDSHVLPGIVFNRFALSGAPEGRAKPLSSLLKH